MEAIYRKKFTVQVSDVDFSQKLKLSTLFVYLQDMATEHAEIIGAGREAILKYDVIWVLIRAKVNIMRYPKWNEEIIVETWPQQPNKIEFERNFIIYDSNNNEIIRAITSWVLIDINSRKLKRSNLISHKFPLVDREKAIDCEMGKIKSKGRLNKSYEKQVGYSDIDMNEHLNNSKYLDYIMDCFSLDEHKKYLVTSIEVDYIHEALPGRNIGLYKELSEIENNTVYVEGIDEESNTNIFKSQVEIKRVNSD